MTVKVFDLVSSNSKKVKVANFQDKKSHMFSI